MTLLGDRAVLTGSGVAEGVPVTFTVDVTSGPPDTFSIVLSNGYSAEGEVTNGRGINIKTC